jgi:hypothetical protein
MQASLGRNRAPPQTSTPATTPGDGSRHCKRHTTVGQARHFGLHLTLGATPLATAFRQTPGRPVMMSPDLGPPGLEMARMPTAARRPPLRTATAALLAPPEVAEPAMLVPGRCRPTWPAASPVWPFPAQLDQEPATGRHAPRHHPCCPEVCARRPMKPRAGDEG